MSIYRRYRVTGCLDEPMEGQIAVEHKTANTDFPFEVTVATHLCHEYLDTKTMVILLTQKQWDELMAIGQLHCMKGSD